MRALGNSKNGVFYYPAKFNATRTSFQFTLSGQKAFKREFEQVLDLARFLTFPSVTQDNFHEVCGRTQQINEENDTQEDLMDESICVFLMSNSSTLMPRVQKTVEQFQENHLEHLEESLLRRNNIWGESVGKLQLVHFTSQQHPRITKVLATIENLLDAQHTVAFALDLT